jgi:hypothetical protein
MPLHRRSPGIAMDDSMWPLVVITFPSSTTEDDWVRMFQAYEQYYERREPFHVVNDGISVNAAISASQRRLIANKAKEHEPMSVRWCLGGATVVSNPITRGVVTAITWIAPPAYKLTLHATLFDAVGEALHTLERNGIQVPERALLYRRSLKVA